MNIKRLNIVFYTTLLFIVLMIKVHAVDISEVEDGLSDVDISSEEISNNDGDRSNNHKITTNNSNVLDNNENIPNNDINNEIGQTKDNKNENIQSKDSDKGNIQNNDSNNANIQNNDSNDENMPNNDNGKENISNSDNENIPNNDSGKENISNSDNENIPNNDNGKENISNSDNENIPDKNDENIPGKDNVNKPNDDESIAADNESPNNNDPDVIKPPIVVVSAPITTRAPITDNVDVTNNSNNNDTLGNNGKNSSTSKEEFSNTTLASFTTSGSITISTGDAHYLDDTTFVGGLNQWDLEGEMHKLNLSKVPPKDRLVPLLNSSQDNVVVIFQISQHYPTIVKKSFSAMPHGRITITSFVNFTEFLSLKGYIIPEFNQSERIEFLNYSNTVLQEANQRWFQITNALPNITVNNNFEVKLLFSALEPNAFWAVDRIVVEDREITTTQPVTTMATTDFNLTSEIPDDNATDININVTDNSDSDSTDNDNLHEVKMVARAIWEAFYVFLALFIACLMALIALIAKQRCRQENPPAAVSTYNPRSSSYRLDKVYDNPSYNTNQV